MSNTLLGYETETENITKTGTEIQTNGDKLFKIAQIPSWQDGPGVVGFLGEDAFFQIMLYLKYDLISHHKDQLKKWHSVDGFINGEPYQLKTQTTNYLLRITQEKSCTIHHRRPDGTRDHYEHSVGKHEGKQINLYFAQYQHQFYTKRWTKTGRIYFSDNKYAQDNWNHMQIFKACFDKKTYRGTNGRGPFTAYETELVARVEWTSMCEELRKHSTADQIIYPTK